MLCLQEPPIGSCPETKNLATNLPPHSSNAPLYIILSPTYRFSTPSLQFNSSDKTMYFSSFPYVLHTSPISSSLVSPHKTTNYDAPSNTVHPAAFLPRSGRPSTEICIRLFEGVDHKGPLTPFHCKDTKVNIPSFTTAWLTSPPPF
jgi:hypothetical protein